LSPQNLTGGGGGAGVGEGEYKGIKFCLPILSSIHCVVTKCELPLGKMILFRANPGKALATNGQLLGLGYPQFEKGVGVLTNHCIPYI
jgi:hypothetical protein